MTYENYTRGPGVDRSARQIQHDLGEIRGEIDQTLNALSQQLSPNVLIDHAVEALKNGGGADIARNVSRSVQDNPLPFAIIAAGVGYLLYSERNKRHPSDPFSGSGGTRDGYDFEPIGPFEATGTTGVGQKLAEGAERLREGGQQLRGKMSQLRGNAQDKGQHAAASLDHAGERARQGAQAAKHWGAELVHEQPLVLAGLGLAVGAAAAALLPMSRTEHEVMGGAGHRVREQAKGLASEATRKVTGIAGDVAEAATGAIKQQADKGAAKLAASPVTAPAAAPPAQSLVNAPAVASRTASPTAEPPRRYEQPRATYAPGDAVSPQHLQGPARTAADRPTAVTLNYPPGALPGLKR